MSSRTDLTGQLDRTIRMLEDEISEIENERERLIRLESTRPVGVNVPSHMPHPRVELCRNLGTLDLLYIVMNHYCVNIHLM